MKLRTVGINRALALYCRFPISHSRSYSMATPQEVENQRKYDEKRKALPERNPLADNLDKKGPWEKDTDGYLFGEKPSDHRGGRSWKQVFTFQKADPKSNIRKWEDWEFPWYFLFYGGFVLAGVGLSMKPNTNLSAWARREQKMRIEKKKSNNVD